MEKTKKWWETAIGYIVYPSMFKDSNGDGVGDLQGLISKLDYLKELGVNLLWICPINKSPMDDNGYDVSDYFAINPQYGTMEDFETLLLEAHKRDIRILIDFVLNHTSDEHPWFKKAIEDPSFEERGYYIIRPGKKEGEKLLPPNNWKGFFSTSVWERIPGSEDFYMHLFSKKMPDVNWENPKLREKYYEVARFYLDKGVDGFRMDALAHLAKDTTYSDSTNPTDENGLAYDTDRFSNREEMFTYLQMFKENVFKHYDCCTVGEVGGCISPEASLRLTDKKDGSITMAFNFDTVWNNGAYGSVDKKDEEIITDVISLKDNFMRWYNACHERSAMPLYWCNHDHPRVLSQYGSTKYRNESSKMLFATMLFLYGTPFIYQGDEIGMSNVDYENIDDFNSDVGNVNLVKELRGFGKPDDVILRFLRRASRTNARTPIQWENSENAGFGGASINKPNGNYKEGVNVLDEMKDPWSILNFFQYAIKIRKDPLITEQVVYGNLSLIDRNHPDVFAYMHEGNPGLLVISNFRSYDVKFSFNFNIKNVLLQNYDGVQLDNHVLSLRPFECLVLQVR